MMSVFIAYLVSLGPLILGAIAIAVLLVGIAPWMWRHPDRWVFWIILALSFSPGLGGSDPDGSVFRQVTWGSLFGLAIGIVMFGNQASISAHLRTAPVSLYLLICFIFLSVSWSPVPMTSFKRAAQVLGVMMLVISCRRRPPNGLSMQTQLIGPTGAFLMIGLFSAVAAPSMAFDTDQALRAITSHKNTWGQFSLVACLVFLFASVNSSHKRWAMLLGFVAATASLILSRSITSVLGLAVVLSAVVFWRIWRTRSATGAVLVFCLASAVAISAVGYTVYAGKLPFEALIDLIYRATGRTSSLTGRTFLWQLMYEEISRHPWLGVGYGGFWTGSGGLSDHVVARLNWGPPGQAHSGYIDVVNEIGVVGSLLAVWVLVTHAAKIVRLFRSSSQRIAGFHGALLLGFLIVNYAESSLIRTTHLMWIFLCASIVEVHLHAVAQSSESIETTRNLRLARRSRA